MQKSVYFPFYLLTAGICLLLLLPAWVQHGMFMDGVQYACVSKNMAAGKGTFWFPYLSESWWYGIRSFMEHPPLFYSIEAVFFRLFGNGPFTERIFCAAMLLLNALLIHLLWKRIADHWQLEKKLSWLPLSLWISIPVCFWAFQNNIIEILVSVFTLLSVYLTLLALTQKKYPLLLIVLSGACVFLATLSKGIPGFFPIATVLMYFVFIRDISVKRMLLYTVLLLAVPALIYFLLILLNPSAKESLTFYVTMRLLHRIQSVPSTDTRFFILGGLLSELLPVFVITIALLFVRVKERLARPVMRCAFFFLAVGLCGTLPLMLTLVQNKFYFVPALPFYAIGFALILHNRVQQLSVFILNSRARRRGLLAVALFLCAGGIVYSVTVAGNDFRDTAVLSEARIISPKIKGNKLVSAEPSVFEDWNFQFYLLRYYDITITPLKDPLPYLITRDMQPGGRYEKIALPTQKYKLYRLKNNP